MNRIRTLSVVEAETRLVRAQAQVRILQEATSGKLLPYKPTVLEWDIAIRELSFAYDNLLMEERAADAAARLGARDGE